MTQHSNPLEQFKVVKIIDLNVLGFDLSMTNSALFIVIAAIMGLSYLYIALNKAQIIPSRLQLSAELLYVMILEMIDKNIGEKGRVFMPLIFSLFILILLANALGLMPYGFTVTSNIEITFTIAIFVFLIVTLYGIFKHGLKFFNLFLPHGTPNWLAPLMIIIELFTYLSRPISLSLRLTANMIAGHVLLKVMAGFIISLGLLFKFLPVPFIVILIGFEFFVAILQAYIFSVLTCIYLNDAVNLH